MHDFIWNMMSEFVRVKLLLSQSWVTYGDIMSF